MTPNPSIWQASTAYAVGDYVEPPAGSETGFIYRCAIAGMSASTAPAFPPKLSAEVVEAGGVTWICAGEAPLFSADDLIRVLGRAIAVEALDQDGDGEPDVEIVNEVRFDASSYVRGAIGGNYDFPIDSPIPNELKRLGLAAGRAIVSERAPEVMRIGVTELYERIDRQLSQVRSSVRRLDIPLLNPANPSPTPPAPVRPKPRNVGGIISDSGQRMFIDSADGTSNSGDF